MKVILLGAPASGKGTLTAVILQDMGAIHLSTGNILRDNIKDNTPLGIKAKTYMNAGKLVPDELVIDLVRDTLEKIDKSSNIVFDGFPRTVKQADALDEILKELDIKLDGVFDLNVPREVLYDRMMGRRTCPKCNKAYHIKTLKPKVEGICDDCNVPLEIRADQTDEVFNERMRVYDEQTKPLITYYKEKGLLYELDFFERINDVYKQMKEKLGI